VDSFGAHTILAPVCLLIAIVMCALMLVATPARGGKADSALTIFHADSLTAYMDRLAQQFADSYPGITVHKEGTGSLDAIRRVTDLHLPCDIVITADWRLLLKPRNGLDPWVIVFAGNSMGLLYTAHSRGAGSITSQNWFDVLLSDGVRYSHSNPERDPAGYWTLIVWQLAERYYHRPGLAAHLAAGCPLSLIRPKSVDLISLLQSGELDYYFGYASDARLGDLQFLALPPEINLSEFSRGAEYAQARVEVGSASKLIAGASIAYGATLTANPPNRAAAIEFLKMMLGEPGRKAAEASGLIAYLSPLGVDAQHKLPQELRPLVRPLEANRR
jgi:molybdate/tungstate transport system substrate-binding protein